MEDFYNKIRINITKKYVDTRQILDFFYKIKFWEIPLLDLKKLWDYNISENKC